MVHKGEASRTNRRIDESAPRHSTGITSARGLPSEEMLDQTARRAWELASRYGEQACLAFVALIEKPLLKPRAAYPKMCLSAPERSLNAIQLGDGEPVGLMRRCVLSGETQLVGDVSEDKGFARYDLRTRSALAVPIKSDNQMLGVLSVRHPKYYAFSLDDVLNVESLAAQTAVAIQSVLQHSELAQAYDELAELDRRKSEFLSTVSHELRSPLASIKLCLQNTLDGLYGGLNSTQEERLRMALEKTEEEEYLVANLLDLVRIEANTVAIEPTLQDIGSLVQDVAMEFRPRAVKKGLNLDVVLPEEPLKAFVDGYGVKRIVANLIDNSIKFTESGQLTVAVSAGETVVSIEVEDTGIGIPEEEIEKIFSRFYQVDGSLTRRIGGAGIGLSVVREYVERHQGQITIESELGRGTKFAVLLPREATRTDKEVVSR